MRNRNFRAYPNTDTPAERTRRRIRKAAELAAILAINAAAVAILSALILYAI